MPRKSLKSDRELKMEASQAAYLAAWATAGNVQDCAKAAGVSPSTAYRWHLMGGDFVGRLEVAQGMFKSSLEQRAMARVDNPIKGTQGSDILLIALLNANYSEKYRPNTVITDSTARETLEFMRKLAKRKDDDGESKAKESTPITVSTSGVPAVVLRAFADSDRVGTPGKA